MATTILRCKRCERKLNRTPLNESRGYGSVCWEKEGKFLAIGKLESEVDQVNEIASLKRELEELRAMVHNLRASPRAVSTNGEKPMPTHKSKGGKIDLMVGGWDPSELATNPLFLKMQAIVGN